MDQSHNKTSYIWWWLVSQLCLNLCDPMDCSPPGFSVHGILQARILEWDDISFLRVSSWLRDQTHVSCIGRQILYLWATREAPNKLYGLFLKSWKHSEANTILSSYWSDIPGRLWTQRKGAKPLPSGMLTCPLDDPKGLGQKSESSSAWASEDCLLEVKINWK